MDVTTHIKEIMADGSSIDGEQQAHFMTERASVRHVSAHPELPQVCQTRTSATTSTVVGPRGTHALTEPEFHEVTNFAPLTTQASNSIQRQLSIYGNREPSPRDSDVDEQCCVDQSSDPTFVRKPSSLTRVSVVPEISNAEPFDNVSSSDADTHARSSYNDQDTGSGSPVYRHQSIDRETDNHGKEVLLKTGGHEYGQQIGRSAAMNLQQHEDTVYIVEESSLRPKCPASRSSSASIRSVGNLTLRPQICDTRVKKVSVAPSSPRLLKSGSTPTPYRVPTEEDLLLLLMRRQRIRDHAYNRVLNDLHQLQAENQQLHSEGLTRDAELVDVKSKWHDALRESHIRETDIRAFGDKYDKLKAWARDMHDAFASTRAEGSRLNDEISKLRTEKEAQINERDELLEKINGIAEPMRKFKETISDLRATSTQLQTTQDLLDQAQQELQSERFANKAHTSQIERLESDQQSMNARFLKQQDEMQSSLSLVSSLLQKNDNGFLHKIVAELTNSVQGLRRDIATKAESSAQFSSLLDATEQNHTKLSTAINNIAHAQAEQQSIEDLRKEIDELNAKHAIKLAEVNEAQLETAASLANAQREVDEERAKSSGIEVKYKEIAKRLSENEGKSKQTEDCLTEKLKFVKQLQDEKEKLQEEVHNVGAASLHLEEEIERLNASERALREAGEDRVTKISNKYGAEIADLKRNAKAHEADVQEKDAKIAELERACEECQASIMESQEDLKNAQDRIAALESTIRTSDSQLEASRNRVDVLQTRVSGIPDLEREVKKQAKQIQVLSKDLSDCLNEVSTKQISLSKTQEKVEELQAKISEFKKESETLSNAHEQCGKKDEEINTLRSENDKLAAELQSVSTLLELLTDEEKMALDEKVVHEIKFTIRRLQEQDRNTSAGDNEAFAGPRRAANRDDTVYDEDVAVPDSQSQALQQEPGMSDLSKDTGGWDPFLDNNSSPLSSVGQAPDLATGSRSELNIVTSDEFRPATSNDEMLLRSSDTSIYPRTQTQATIVVPASSHDISPMRTRQGSQIRHGTPRPQSSADGERVVNYSTPPAHPREVHPPNSAAKRRQTGAIPESVAKRRHVNMKDLEVRLSKTSADPSQSSDSEGTSKFPVSGCKGIGATTSKMSAPHKSKKKVATSRKNSKSARMEAQFNAPAL